MAQQSDKPGSGLLAMGCLSGNVLAHALHHVDGSIARMLSSEPVDQLVELNLAISVLVKIFQTVLLGLGGQLLGYQVIVELQCAQNNEVR